MDGADDFEPRLGRMRARGKAKGRRYVGQVIAATNLALAGRPRARSGKSPFSGARIGRGAGVGRLLGHGAKTTRRVTVKASIVRMRGNRAGRVAAHLRYLERDGTAREGAAGRLYGPGEDRVDRKAFLGRATADRHQFRFIVSAEDGTEYDDLKSLMRRLMAQAEQDLGTHLDWAAVDHFDTGHPHSHIVVRGVDDRGRDLIIGRDYLSVGLRARAGELVELDLGLPSPVQARSDRTREMVAERRTGIDRAPLANISADPKLQRREVVAAAARLSRELILPYAELPEGSSASGVYRRRIDLINGRFALVERAHDFVLLPWRPELARKIGRDVTARLGPDGVIWSFGRTRTGPS